ncbi:DUF1150 family protein [Granulibacter bethesdensis]|uniref:DUF1150 family protein n=1 Tax=Granulibacter bethesdensis TaxID=364410 RepID=UPI0003F1E007|nr:DUF1150 family protein [Granulibacter bethesdensis]AHJ65107.1 Hypothetical protein GbCGDNIH4_0694 [Granulibacter bethesdensis CGDNIH4]APH59015.1 Hypothetical protein GbCGDNIH7_0694 [Granulibacter bethesdensis]
MAHPSFRPSRDIPADSMMSDATGMFDIRRISPKEFAMLGVSQVAYIKPVIVDGNSFFAIHAADGTAMALADECAAAVEAIQDHDMVPAYIH